METQLVGRHADRHQLILRSALMLFTEVALIRWTGSNIVYLSYFSNFVLLGSFFGIGIGFLRAAARTNLWRWAPLSLTLLVGFVLAFPVEIDRSGGDIIYFGDFSQTGLPPWATLPLVFALVAVTMATIAHGVAQVFGRFEPLEAYRFDILGSIFGIVAFSVLSFMSAPPVAWGVIVAILFAVVLGRDITWVQVGAIVVLLGLLTAESRAPFDSWSPYYKVTVDPGDEGSYGVAVNGIPHQAILSTARRREREPQYFVPYERAGGSPLDDVLVIGAGNGSDVAIALEYGAGHVDAVEIDPRLLELGQDLHPNDPYADERVDAYVDDGRAFLERTDRRYDLILFALPDSLTLVSGQSSLRLESYLFTTEAMEEAREHLKPHGVFSMYNFYREQWLVDRLARTLFEVYGHDPCIDHFFPGALAVFTIGREPDSAPCDRQLDHAKLASAPAPTTDDYPFVYLRDPGIPAQYLVTLLLILVLGLIGVRGAAGPLRNMRPYADLFFMGVAFLLLETKSVVQFALLFGTTWFVNALVFIGILLAVYLAVEVARRFRPQHPVRLYYALAAAVLVAYAVPAGALLSLSLPLRFVAATVITFAPIFIANLVFAARFRDTASSTTAFGANLLGAMVGGVLEYAALVVGYRMLSLAAAAIYGLAFLFGRRYLSPVTAD